MTVFTILSTWSLIFYLLTIFSVPYVAMGYEMSDDFKEKNQYYGHRSMDWAVGMARHGFDCNV
jgi:Na+/melibiose symporter-like transporter